MTNIEIRKINNLIEMLTSIQDQIPKDAEAGFYAELEVALDVTVNYLQSTLDGTPVKTNNFKLTFVYDGYEFNDVVNATDEQTAFSYLCWICNDNDDLHFVKAEICNDLPSYWCPVGWVKPDLAYVNRGVARYRSLMQSLEVAGITQHDYYTPELDKVMRSLGYSAKKVVIGDTVECFACDDRPGTYIDYTRDCHHTLRVEIKEAK
jgi:hypothetical protein